MDDWAVAGFDMARNSFLVGHGEGAAAAYGHVLRRGAQRVIEAWGVVHPAHRGRGVGAFLARALEARALELARGEPGVAFRTFAPETDGAARELFELLGYAIVRRFLHMERALGVESSASPPPGIEFRPFRPGLEEAVWRAADEGFADHWGYEPTPFADWRGEWMGERFRPELMLLAMSGDEIAGVLLEDELEGVGWIGELAVRPAWRRRGIATALLQRAFADLAGRGLREVRLSVDAESTTGATQLYERVGMRVRRAWLVYERPLSG